MSSVFAYRQPDFIDTQGEECLLVWGELAQWLLVDREVVSFLSHFDGRRSVEEVITRFAADCGAASPDVAQTVSVLLGELSRRGILYSPDTSPVPPSDEICIANVTVNLTNRCNLRCKWCYNSERTAEELPVEVLMDAVAAGAPLYAPDATFIILGGEPFIDPARLFEALERSRDIFSAPTLVSTNGTLLTQEIITALRRFPVEVQVSVDGGRREFHEAVRGAGTFEKTIANAQRLVDSGVYTILSMVYTRENEGALEEFFDLALGLGVQEARLIPLRAMGRGKAFIDLLPRQQVVFETLLELLERRPEVGRLLGRDFFSILASVCARSRPRLHCGVGRNVVFIDANGAIYPCPNHVGPAHYCGRIPEDSLESALRSSPVMQAVRRCYLVSNYPDCRECPFRHWCAGDCRGEALSISGDPHGASPHCAELKAVIPRMLWRIAKETMPLPIGKGATLL